ncbi:MAG: hypothetical protein Q4G58_09365 [bacterium]|nr:hypothetical protein [bacterium]
MSKWYEMQGESSDVVFASRVRLSRNMDKYLFSKKMTDSDAVQLVEEVLYTFKDYSEEAQTYQRCNLSELNEIEKLSMVERQILTKDLATKKQCSGLVVSEDESSSVMINGEDHLKIQSLVGGMDMKQAIQKVNSMDDYASELLGISFSEKYGYLTSSPADAGTGMKASYLLFLPALAGAGKMKRLAEEVTKYGVTLQGLYTEGTESNGNLFQISNQKTMGMTEEDIINNLDNIALQVVKQERKRREYVLANNYDEIEDQVYRSYGVLKYAKQINSKDALTLLSQVKFGADTDIIGFQIPFNIYNAMIVCQPYSLQCQKGKYVGSKVRDKLRAEYLNHTLPELET